MPEFRRARSQLWPPLGALAVSLLVAGAPFDPAPAAGAAPLAASAPRGRPVRSVRSERRFYATTWDTVFAAGSIDDSLLLMPRLLASSGGRVFVYDYVRHAVSSLSGEGEVLWSFGRSGAGPGEFGNAVDLEIGPDGDIWVNDPASDRLTVLAPSGKLARTIALHGVHARDIVPLRSRALLGLIGVGDRMWAEMDRTGNVLAEGGYPDAGLASMDPYRRQSMMSQSGDIWAVVFPWGNPFYVYEGADLRCEGRLVEGRPLAEAQSRGATAWVVDVDVGERSVYMLAKGETADALRAIDAYSRSDCGYLGSYRLPMRVRAMDQDRGVFYVELEEPYPRVLGLVPRRR